jgi:hypothetical protein
MVICVIPDKDKRPDSERDEPVKIDLDPEDALKALLKVDPQAEPVEQDPSPPHGDPLAD